jgi:hypothetical protein
MADAATGGFLFAQTSERLHVRYDIFNLRRFQDFLERRHQGVAVFDPSLQGFIGNFVVVHRERSAL